MNNLSIDCMRETDYIISFIRKEFRKRGFEKAVIGYSGGIDSAVVAELLMRALGLDNVFVNYLPCGQPDGYEIPQKQMEKLFDNINTIDIFKMVGAILDGEPQFRWEEENDEGRIRIGNVTARVRMICLFDQSAKHNALVVGTGNRTEWYLGYFTIHGDGACAIEPIGHLYKTQVRQLAGHLGISKDIIDKPPSAELWAGQTDEAELGATYEEIDKALGEINGELPIKTVSDDFKAAIWLMVNNSKFKREMPASLLEDNIL